MLAVNLISPDSRTCATRANVRLPGSLHAKLLPVPVGPRMHSAGLAYFAPLSSFMHWLWPPTSSVQPFAARPFVEDSAGECIVVIMTALDAKLRLIEPGGIRMFMENSLRDTAHRSARLWLVLMTLGALPFGHFGHSNK